MYTALTTHDTVKINTRWLSELIRLTACKPLNDELSMLLAADRPSVKSVRMLLSEITKGSPLYARAYRTKFEEQDEKTYASRLLDLRGEIILQYRQQQMCDIAMRDQFATS